LPLTAALSYIVTSSVIIYKSLETPGFLGLLQMDCRQ
jgi:hypothetical protein